MCDGMTIDELKQINIDIFVNLLKIKKAEKSINDELDYQIRVWGVKLQALGIPTDDLKI